MEAYDKSWVCVLQKQPEALEFNRLYSVKQKIGAGTYGNVLVAKHREQEHGAYAAKVLETTQEATYLAWAIERADFENSWRSLEHCEFDQRLFF